MSDFDVNLPRNTKGQGCLILFGIPFFAAGAFMLWTLVFSPLLQLSKSMGWVEAPCEITKSELKVNSDSDGNTYRPIIHYVYEFRGQMYESERVDFGASSSSSDREGESACLKDYPLGSKRTCFVDPDKPYEAVLIRDWGRGIFKWIAIPFGGVFALTGLCVSIYGASPWIFKRRKKKTVNKEVILKPSMQRLGKLGGILFINMFWNGIVSVFLISWLDGLFRGTAKGFVETWGLGLFLTPFIAIGGFMFWNLIKEFNNLRAPKVSVMVQQGLYWKCGETIDLQWHIPMNAMVDSVQLDFVCRESATYQRGTNTTTDDKIVAEIPIASEKSFRDSSIRFQVPVNIMPTFISQNNAIEWGIRVRSQGPGPDADDLYMITLEREGV